MAIAVRIARASTGRDEVAVCGYHGWNDWYLAANVGTQGKQDGLTGHLLPGLDPAGVPQALAGTTHTFMYNKIDQLKKVLEERSGKIAAVVMETTRNQDPEPGFLQAVRELCDKHGARLVFDEVSIGWRLGLGGAHMKYGVYPDIAVFAKALGNGFPISAIIGTTRTMEAAQGSFISSSYWTEGTGSAAAVATIKKLMAHNVPGHVNRIGEKMRTGLISIAQKNGLTVKTMGHPCWAVLAFEGKDNVAPAAIQTFFTAKMLKHGFLTGGGFYPMFTHQDRHIDRYHAAAEIVVGQAARAIKAGTLIDEIGGPVKHTGFARLA
jgi:glutamate-1-semialdehyde 2,1-aminomutase